MKPLFVIVVWFIFVGANILIAEWNDSVRRHRIANKNPKQIEHFWYGLGYCILCGIPFYISRNWLEFFSLILLHASVFPVSYNLFVGLSPFTLSKTSKAIFDKTLVKWKFKSTEEVNIIAFCISIILLFIQIFIK